MAELKTQKTDVNAYGFVESLEDEVKRNDCLKLIEIFKTVSKEAPVMWGSSIIGFGQYHYKSEKSRQEGDWPLTAFSPRKQNITLYIMSGFGDQKKLLEKLGKHKISGGSCLYIKRLSDIDTVVLKDLIKASLLYMKDKYKLL